MMHFFWLFAVIGFAAAENGLDGWLRYARLPQQLIEQATVPSHIIALNDTSTSPVYTAGQELKKGIAGVLGQDVEVIHSESGFTNPKSQQRPPLIVGKLDAFEPSYLEGLTDFEADSLEGDGFYLSTGGDTGVVIVGNNERGALYGAFEYLSMLAQGNFSHVSYVTNPSAPIRWVNQWDNMDGTIERGYAGLSIFFANGTVREDLSRVPQYARLLASIRINGLVVNNVNADPTLLTEENMAGLKRIADLMRPWGIPIGISLNFASPKDFGGLDSFDPLDEEVIQWWTDITDSIYEHVPDMAGYLVKASSEGQPGPETYNRTLAQGANLFARAAKPHGGIVMFRAFVYDNNLSYDNWYNDRANAQVEFFKHLDGKFDDNIVVQIKYGPIDFQVREAVSPLFANLRETPMAMELQVAQEYLGQQCHLVYLPPLWRTILDFDLRVDSQQSIVGTDILTGKTFNQTLTGYTAVVNVGLNTTWLGSHLAMSNLYAYGHLAWDPTLPSPSLLDAWTRQTFSSPSLDSMDPLLSTLRTLSLPSWEAYENYTGNLGVQTLTDITGPHYGPNPQSQDHNGWGQWTRADSEGIGMDRTVSNGTGNAGQYPTEVAAMYENINSTPDDLLLWFHHVPWTHRLSSKYDGKTIIQHIYDAHFSGASTAASFPGIWEAGMMSGGGGLLVDEERFQDILFRLEYQAGHAIVWRDSITQFYYNLTEGKFPDENGDRVGGLIPPPPPSPSPSPLSLSPSPDNSSINHPTRNPWHRYRLEAESFPILSPNYQSTSVNPFEAASGLKILQSSDNSTAVYAETGVPGWVFSSSSPDSSSSDSSEGQEFDVAVAYYDLYEGSASWTLSLQKKNNGEKEKKGKIILGKWKGDLEHRLGYTLTRGIDGHSATRVTFRNITLRKGDRLRVECLPQGRETCPLDYIVLLPVGEGVVD